MEQCPHCGFWNLPEPCFCSSCGERLEGVECLERRLVAQAAERSEQQGAAEERSREGRRVAPVTAAALLARWEVTAAKLTDQDHYFAAKGGYEAVLPIWKIAAGVLMDCARDLRAVISNAPTTASDAYANSWTLTYNPTPEERREP